MKIDLKLDQLSQQLTNVAQDAYPKTGALKSSIKVEIIDDSIVISFNNYGLFQDAGVKGVLPSRNSSGQGFDKKVFQYKEVFSIKRKTLVPVGGNLPWGARVNIRKFGIPAKPWIARMITSLSDQIAKDIEITLPPQIEAEVAKLLGSIK
jgi:hypothetical protein